jgi:queuine/archaeosine tRNA-ribosyltransferase
MTESRRREELAESRAEIARVRERLATALPRLHILHFARPEMVQSRNGLTAGRFLSGIGEAARIGRWDGSECL